MSIEVKSKLAAPELRQGIANARSVKALRPQFREPNPPSDTKSSILCCIFAYDSTRKPANEPKTLQRYARQANTPGGPTVHVPISVLCIANAAFTYCQIHDQQNPANHTFPLIRDRPLASFLSFLHDTTVFHAAQRSPMYSAHYLR
jgi:hypothetical protein